MKYKIVLAGDGAVGKTSLINRFVTGAFAGDYKATIGVAITAKSLIVNDKEVNLQIWDVAGQTLFRQFRKKFYTKAEGALLVFDLTVPKSLDNLHLSWMSDIKEITGDIPTVLVGNKVDLRELQAISPEEISSFLDQHPMCSHINTSALTGEGVEKAFHDLVTCIVNQE
ncbi:MAG: GTP-binding protein [Candidatus Heimdallarchaeota archaeon]|nr:MAG: GTP-binding protein [Candidatus Heimdallarchaeota archaeon]